MTTQPAEKYNIAVVDDEKAARDGMKRLLWGMRREIPLSVHEAEDADSCVQLLAEASVDCLLLDYQLPGKDGLTLLGEIIADGVGPAVIMVTGKGDEQLAAEAMKAGAKDYLVKGFIDAQNLKRAVSNALEKRNLELRIEKQQQELLEAERQRVMMESLGAACHHLGQPASVISMCLDMLKERMNQDAEDNDWLENAYQSLEKMRDILHRMQEVSEYRTVPYCTREGQVRHILDLDASENHEDESTETSGGTPGAD